MADDSTTDIVMYMTLSTKAGQMNGPIACECRLAKAPNDIFMNGFFPALPGSPFGNFFEVLDFDFGFNVSEQEDKSADRSNSQAQSHLASTSALELVYLPQARRDAMSGGARRSANQVKGPFATWRSMQEGEWQNQKYGVDIEAFEFTRLMDSASPILFKACTESWKFDKAVLVKRLSQGETIGNTNRLPLGYLRFEFVNVMLKSLRWDDGELVKEKCTIVFEEFTITYRQQKYSGDLESPLHTAHWSREEHTNPYRVASLLGVGGL